jgi:hypothetical protein
LLTPSLPNDKVTDLGVLLLVAAVGLGEWCDAFFQRLRWQD